jgi:carbonic anhydrase/acetyltransferase-like protein (isoleucine patch superfamily)
MVIRALGEHTPDVDAGAWVSEAAYVVGQVSIGPGSSVWPGAVVRGDFAPITIGSDTVIEDNCVVHTGEPLSIGDGVIVGHAVVVHCRSVGSRCLIGNGATLLDGAVIGDLCTVAAGSVVLGGTVVPDGSFVVGAPAVVRPATEAQIERLRHSAASHHRYYGAMAQRYRSSGL